MNYLFSCQNDIGNGTPALAGWIVDIITTTATAGYRIFGKVVSAEYLIYKIITAAPAVSLYQ